MLALRNDPQAALTRVLIDKGVLTQDEVDAKVLEVRERLGADAA